MKRSVKIVPRDVFALPSLWTTRPVKVAVVGAGGTGSQLISGLARLHVAMRSLGHPFGLHVGVWDGDNVSPSNIGRQLYSAGDIGRNKAVVSVNRLNAYFGLNWEARPERFCFGSRDQTPDLVITCVDSAAARREVFGIVEKRIKSSGFERGPLWLDCGNSQKSGQVMLGKFSDKYGGILPEMRQLLPEIFDTSLPEDNRPSCSLAEALESQDLFINQAIATYAGQLLWTLIRQGELSICGYWVNLEEGRVVPEPIARKRKAAL